MSLTTVFSADKTRFQNVKKIALKNLNQLKLFIALLPTLELKKKSGMKYG